MSMYINHTALKKSNNKTNWRGKGQNIYFPKPRLHTKNKGEENLEMRWIYGEKVSYEIWENKVDRPDVCYVKIEKRICYREPNTGDIKIK